jgi:hypothetical protein
MKSIHARAAAASERLNITNLAQRMQAASEIEKELRAMLCDAASDFEEQGHGAAELGAIVGSKVARVLKEMDHSL